jgi:lantibiotic transport system ATP-binding protein
MEGRIVKMEMMLQTQNLCKYFRKQKAVNNVSLNIEKEQIYGLLGPNGAGKSTTLKMLTGMMKPTAGKIYFDGKLLDRKDLSKIGALIENPPIYENLSARENLKVRQLLHGSFGFLMFCFYNINHGFHLLSGFFLPHS